MKRVFGYARPSDYAVAGGMAAASPLSFWVMERVSPSHVGRGGFSPVMRLATAIGLVGGLHILYQRSCSMSISMTSLPLGEAVRLTITQTASMVSRRTQGKSRWTPGRWSTKSRWVNLCMVLQKSPLIYKGLQRGTRGIRSCSSIFFHGSMLSITTRLVIPAISFERGAN